MRGKLLGLPEGLITEQGCVVQNLPTGHGVLIGAVSVSLRMRGASCKNAQFVESCKDL
jgi:hypothetical protein